MASVFQHVTLLIRSVLQSYPPSTKSLWRYKGIILRSIPLVKSKFSNFHESKYVIATNFSGIRYVHQEVDEGCLPARNEAITKRTTIFAAIVTVSKIPPHMPTIAVSNRKYPIKRNRHVQQNPRFSFLTGSLAKQRIRTSNSILIMDISVTTYMSPPVVAPSYQETVHAKRKCGTQESSTPFIQPYLATTKEQCPFELYLQSTRKYIYQFLVQGHQRFMLIKLRSVLLFVVSMVSGKLHASLD